MAVHSVSIFFIFNFLLYLPLVYTHVFNSRDGDYVL